MSKPQFIYFNVYAKGEKIRVLLAHAKVDYDDIRLNDADFMQRKAAGEFNNGQVPVWLQNGKQYNESSAILRFLGKQYGYYPADPDQAWQSDAIVDYCNDVQRKLYADHMNKKFDQEAKQNYRDTLNQILTFFAKTKVSSGTKFIASDQISIGDFCVAALLFAYVFNDALAGGEAFTSEGKKLLQSYEAELGDYVKLLQTECADYLANRPPCDF